MNNTFGQLPTVVRHDNKVSDFQCRMYAEIQSLSNKYNYCFASNDYLAKIFSKTPETISRAISGLQKLGYLTVVIEDGYKRKMKVKMDFSDMEPIDEKIKGGCQKDQGGLTKMSRGVDENVMTANNIIQLDKSNEINGSRIVETSSTPILDADEIEDIEQQIYASKATEKNPTPQVAPTPRPKAKRTKVDNPTPIREMFDIYSDQYARMNGGEKPEFMTKYCQPMKKLYGILEARQIQSGIVPLDKLQPWRDFIEMWGKYLQDHPKETYFTANFNPATFYSQFNTIVAKIKNQPKTTAQKWEQYYRENTQAQ